jgi:hypothetical protein
MSASFSCRLGHLPECDEIRILGALSAAAAASGFSRQYLNQTYAWQQQIAILKETAKRLVSDLPVSDRWPVLLEFEIPRRGKRPDVILLADDLILSVEFKVGAAEFTSADSWQALSYALDLRDFHLGSLGRRIFPMLVATEALGAVQLGISAPGQLVSPVAHIGRPSSEHLSNALATVYKEHHDRSATILIQEEWEGSPYRPTPTIVEAAEILFAGHTVGDISHAFAKNLDVTSSAIADAVDQARTRNSRTICFVTGIPGAGKTLAGLNAAHDVKIRANDNPAAVFLSGNGPLVKIVREALVRDTCRAGTPRHAAERTVSTFISNVHGFIKRYGLQDTSMPPYEHAIIFDEAQRAWNAEAVSAKHGVKKSEPELVLDIMERAPGWAVIVALVGGGQEIHNGEAGLQEWGLALNRRSTPWTVIASPDALNGGDSVAGSQLQLDSAKAHLKLEENTCFHLNVSVRSPRARAIGSWVNAVVTDTRSIQIDHRVGGEFPIAITRELDEARNWLLERTDGSQRCGLLASSGALRLRAEGLEVSSGFRKAYSYKDWFLSGKSDSRSSLMLEVAATEFECQGLELDWTAICWGGDFLWDPLEHRWRYQKFLGAKWRTVRKSESQQYIANKYRVLLTRARRGMVIWVPRGDPNDPTRNPQVFDATADHLEEMGVPLERQN